ncbi:MAG: hypothetical protein K0R63_938 [Rickettsiales bacterium]|jgi:uncharacterized membrane protein|nr:hypothetical protein [Rickettsiales bacterium]
MKKVVRDHSIDILRGLAILLMVPANLAPLMVEPHGFWLRFLSSLPAPIFVTLSGMMIAFMINRDPKRHDLKHFIQRGLFLVGIGALIDIAAWGLLPFTTVDVLYLIGITTPLAYLANRLETRWLLGGMGVLIVASVLLQKFVGYTFYPSEFALNGHLTQDLPDQTSIPYHWIADGWFPLVPWFGFMLCGLLLARLRFEKKKIAFDQKTSVIAAIICAVGALGWYFYPGQHYSREGFSELFYPPVPGFILFMMGSIPLLLSAIDRTASFKGWQFLMPFGKASLFFYIVHLLVIGRIILELWEGVGIVNYLIVLTGLYAFLCIINWCLVEVKERFGKKMPLAVRFVVGG